MSAKDAIEGFIRRHFLAPDYHDEEEFKAQEDWFQSFQCESVDESIRSYAAQKYKEVSDHFDALDKKAEVLFGLSGTLTGATFTAVQLFHLPILPSLVPLAFFVAAMVLALVCRLTAEKATPVPARQLMEVQAEEGDFHLELAKSYHMAACGVKIVCGWKGKVINRATVSLCLALTLLVIPLIFSAARPSSNNSSSTAEILIRGSFSSPTR